MSGGQTKRASASNPAQLMLFAEEEQAVTAELTAICRNSAIAGHESISRGCCDSSLSTPALRSHLPDIVILFMLMKLDHQHSHGPRKPLPLVAWNLPQRRARHGRPYGFWERRYEKFVRGLQSISLDEIRRVGDSLP